MRSRESQQSHGLKVCENCENSVATLFCKDCSLRGQLDKKDQTYSFFCVDCSDLHKKLRQFREHQFRDILTPFLQMNRNCSNCEKSICKFFCKNCEEEDRYLCLGCSLFHSKIKSYRDHTILIIDDRCISSKPVENRLYSPYSTAPLQWNSSEWPKLGKACQIFFEKGFSQSVNFKGLLLEAYSRLSDLVDKVRSLSFRTMKFWLSLAVLLALFFLAFFCVKFVFGHHSTSVHTVLIFLIVSAGYYRNNNRRSFENEVLTANIATNRDILQQSREKSILTKAAEVWGSDSLESTTEFPDEFSYERKHRKTAQGISFRPRNRPYVPRKRRQAEGVGGRVVEAEDFLE